MVNKLQKIIKNYLKQNTSHVIVLCKETMPTRHFDRNEAKLSEVEKSHIFACLQANIKCIYDTFSYKIIDIVLQL